MFLSTPLTFSKITSGPLIPPIVLYRMRGWILIGASPAIFTMPVAWLGRKVEELGRYLQAHKRWTVEQEDRLLRKMFALDQLGIGHKNRKGSDER